MQGDIGSLKREDFDVKVFRGRLMELFAATMRESGKTMLTRPDSRIQIYQQVKIAYGKWQMANN